MFGGVVALLIIDRYVYPEWVEPLVTMDERIVAREADLAKLQALKARVDVSRRRYRDLVGRTGTFDTSLVETDVRDRIDKLIDKYKLEDRNVSPSRWAADKKTKLKRCRVTVKVNGSLQSAIAFLADISELPHLMRVGNVKMRPDNTIKRKNKKKKDYVSVTVPLDLWVLPKNRVVGIIHPEDLEQPASVVRHQVDRNYAPLWEGRMFWEYVKPKPLVVQAGRDIRQKPNKRAIYLKGVVIGGDGDYTCAWTPSLRLRDPDKLKTKIDLTQEFEEEYTLTCVDGEGESKEDTVLVTVVAPKEVVVKKPPPKRNPPPVKKERREEWKEGKYMQMLAALCTETSDGQMDQVMIYHNRKKTTNYYGIGDDFDGGKLVYVHPTGGLVRWKNDLYIYPIGEWLNAETKLGGADDVVSAEYPQLGTAAALIREQIQAEVERLEAEAAEQADMDADAKEMAEAERAKVTAPAAKPVVADKSRRPARSTARPVKGIPTTVPNGTKGPRSVKKSPGQVSPTTAKPATTDGKKQVGGQKPAVNQPKTGGLSKGQPQKSSRQRRSNMQERIDQLRGRKKTKGKDANDKTVKGSSKNPQEKKSEQKPAEKKPDTR